MGSLNRILIFFAVKPALPGRSTHATAARDDLTES